MAQQATSTRELQIGGAANRQAPQRNPQGSPDYAESKRQMEFADRLVNLTSKVGSALGKHEKVDEEIRRANEAKFKDAEETRLRVEAKRRLLAEQGADYKTAHFKDVGPAGQYSEQKDLSNPDVANEIYKKEYELAFTTRKVNKFQKSLDNGAEADIKAIHVVWENLQKNEDPDNLVRGMSFDQFATEALSEQKDHHYATFLESLPHLGEVIDKKDINYNAHEDQIAKTEQGIRDKFRLQTLNDAVNDHYEIKKYPGERTISGKKISAASDLLNQAESLRGSQVTEDGRIRGLYSKKEVHGAFIKQYSEKIFLAKSPDDPIFESLNAIFNSDDAHKILELDPNDPKGIGKQYADLRAEADARYLKLTKEKDTKDTASAKATVDQHTQVIKTMHSKAEVMLTKDTLNEDDLAVLVATWENTASWEKGKPEYIDDIAKNIKALKGKEGTKIRSPLTDSEKVSVQKFKENILKAEDREDIQVLKGVLLASTNLSSREINEKLIIVDAHEKRLEAADKAKKEKIDLFEQESTRHADSLKGTQKKAIKGKSSTELTEGLEDYKKKINADSKLTEGKKNELIESREAEIASREQTENDASDVAETTKFNELLADFDPKKITKENIGSLEKILPKIKNGKLKKELENKIIEASKGIFDQEELKQTALNRKAANKAFNKFEKELNLIREMDSEKGQKALQTLQDTLEQNAEFPTKITPFVEAFQTAVANDPAKRDYRNMIATLHGELQKKKTQEQKDAEQEGWENDANASKDTKEAAEKVGQDAVFLLDTEYSQANYDDAYNKIFAKVDMAQANGSNPISEFVFPEERRMSLLRSIRDNKTKNSGQVPSNKELDPKLYTEFQNDINAIEGLATGNLKEAAIKSQMIKLQKAYHDFTLPQQTYEDLHTELQGMNPKGPTIVAPRISGLKTINSKFQGSWSKFDDPEEFLAKGGKEGPQLYEDARSAFEKWHTAWVNGEVKEGVLPYGDLDESGKLEEASKYADRILDYEEGGVMGNGWKTRMETYSNNWDAAMNKQEEGGKVPVAGTGTGKGDNTSSNIYKLFDFSRATTYTSKSKKGE